MSNIIPLEKWRLLSYNQILDIKGCKKINWNCMKNAKIEYNGINIHRFKRDFEDNMMYFFGINVYEITECEFNKIMNND